MTSKPVEGVCFDLLFNQHGQLIKTGRREDSFQYITEWLNMRVFIHKNLLPILITKLHWLVEYQIKTNAFYRFRCHYPLITYLNRSCLSKVRIKETTLHTYWWLRITLNYWGASKQGSLKEIDAQYALTN